MVTSVDELETTQGFLVQGPLSSLNVCGRFHLSGAVAHADDTAYGIADLNLHCLMPDNEICP